VTTAVVWWPCSPGSVPSLAIADSSHRSPELTPQELVYLTDTDHFDHEAIAAVDPRDGSIVAVGRYVHDRGRAGRAEVAFEVADELQSIGIGTALATHIVQLARAHGVALLRRFGFRARSSQGSVIELELRRHDSR
jgi:GNAT superfamily N-acetyltransferase